MNSNIMINALGIGGAIFLVLLMVWFVAVYMKRRVGPDQVQTGAVSLKKISWEEKRRQPRMAVSWRATIDSEQGPTHVQVKDVSQGGAFVVCKHPPPLKTSLLITLMPAEYEPLALNAEVIWSNANVPADKIVNRGMGIRFINNDETVRSGLNQMIVACFEKNDD